MNKENRNIETDKTVSLSRKIWPMYLQVGIIGLLIVVAMWYAMNTGSQAAKKYTPLVHATLEIKLQSAIAHLWFEEIIMGDQSVDINEVRNNLGRAEWYAQVMLEGGGSEEGTVIPLDDPELRREIAIILEKIGEFRTLAEARLADTDGSVTGSDADQRFDEMFITIIEQASGVEASLYEISKRDIQKFQAVQTSLLVICFVLTGVIGVILHRSLKKQLINLAILKATNQQLGASEQQLKASNQQLMASEQQLKAANQQLSASEQQLKAANQQLSASEQQLKAANQQLSASEQQLKASNLQLRKSRQKLSLHVKQTPLGVIEWNTDFEVTEWNKAAERIFGFTREEAVGRHAAGLIIPESVRKITDVVWSDLLAQKGGARSVNANITKDNKCIMCDWYNTPLVDESGDTIGVASLVLDITEANKAEEELRKLAAVVKYSSELVNLADLNGDMIFLNEAGGSMLGVDPDNIQNANIMEVIPDHLTELVENELLPTIMKKGHWEGDLQYRNIKTGKLTDVHAMTFTVNDPETNQPQFLANVSLDITDRKRTEEAIEKSEANYKTTMDNLLVGVVVHGADSKILLSNPEASRILGLTSEQMAGKEAIDPAWSFVYEDSSEMKVEDYPVSKVIKSKKPLHDYIVGVSRPDKEEITWVNVSAIPMLSNEGELEKVVVNFIDISETKRLRQLESRAERLETAGTIAGQVAHDFNNLLGPVMAYPEFIRERLPRNHPALQYLDQIEKASHKIAEINQDLLAMDRRGHYNQSALNLNTIVHQAIDELKPLPKTLVTELDLCEDLMDIMGGAAQIHRVINNLLHNAKDSMQNIGQLTVKTENYYVDDVSIIYGRVPKGEYVKLTISDTGCGIPDDIVQKIFDPFFTTKATDKKRGSGLGMSVVDAVIKDHSGFIDLSTTVGEGTSFYLYFPITRESMDSHHANKTSGGNETILIVDDDDVQREVSSRLLKRLGYGVNTVESGEKAIIFIRENPQNLVILDMIMPGGIDGAETYRQILEIYPQQKAIILSGFSESDRVLEAQKMGAGAFVKKPVTKNIIASAIRTELDRKVKDPIS